MKEIDELQKKAGIVKELRSKYLSKEFMYASPQISELAVKIDNMLNEMGCERINPVRDQLGEAILLLCKLYHKNMANSRDTE